MVTSPLHQVSPPTVETRHRLRRHGHAAKAEVLRSRAYLHRTRGDEQVTDVLAQSHRQTAEETRRSYGVYVCPIYEIYILSIYIYI